MTEKAKTIMIQQADLIKRTMDRIIHCVNFENGKGLDGIFMEASQIFKDFQLMAIYYDEEVDE